MPQNSISVLAVMPTYNESACIESVVKDWLLALSEVGGELMVVNDGSTDQTGEILDRLRATQSRLHIIHQENAGHGAAVLRGYHSALAMHPDYVFQTDSDDQIKSSEFSKLWKERERSKFITGCRWQRKDPFHRLVITKVMALLNLVLFGVWLKDSNIPFRLMKTDFLRELVEILPERLFAPNIHLSVSASRAGCDLLEISVIHEERRTGTVSIMRWRLLKVCFRCALELVSFRFSLIGRRLHRKLLSEKHA